MPTFEQYQQQLAAHTTRIINKTPAATNSVQQMLTALINAMPYYGSPDMMNAHRGILVNLGMVNLPNNAVTEPPMQSTLGSNTSYTYKGPYNGYRNAFYNGVVQTPASTLAAQLIPQANSNLTTTWWGAYAVALLTDAIHQQLSVSLDTGKLATNLTAFHQQLTTALTNAYLAAFEQGFAPTAQALKTISISGLLSQAATTLDAAISNGEFTANINLAISMGGDSSAAAAWFLYNLWVTLWALGLPDLDGAINRYAAAGLDVPIEVSAGHWRNGGYSSWFAPLSGADMVGAALGAIHADMPVLAHYNDAIGPQLPDNMTTFANGYSLSFTTWGTLNSYLPQPASCFGADTAVMMADGNTQPISAIQPGHLVYTNTGPRKVVLVESPQRAGRTLYQLNGQQVFATAAHPFRTAAPHSAKRAAVDAWTLTDSIPTMSGAGVLTLATGLTLSGLEAGAPANILLTQLTPHIAGSIADNLQHYTEDTTSLADNHAAQEVYDLVLEGWERDHPVYYVGGPQYFFAVDAETADPLVDIPTTAAIVTALQSVLPLSRQHLTDPATQLPGIFAQLQHAPLCDALLDPEPLEPLQRPVIPGPDFYMHDGKWDAHASLLEYHLVRRLSRFIRRETAMAWRARHSAPAAGDHFVVALHDLIFAGDAPLPAAADLEISFSVDGWPAMKDNNRQLIIPARDQPRWQYFADQLIDFGVIRGAAPKAMLQGELRTADRLTGRFSVAITEALLQGSGGEHFIFDAHGKVTGRIALELGRVTSPALQAANTLSTRWQRLHALGTGAGLGKAIGASLTTLLGGHDHSILKTAPLIPINVPLMP
ncbi:hypothetical protein F0L74_20340 [Chitinophaga agrisoli]|uniref:Vint domain-containing protein n=1 Tax=Chitinophaga agrisoli TaxID=2607653 RepID=A0A5B2VI40_9BACT|nr:hypothetical protein [Chitinophaga agrisoli]KAA2238575.1 hypothetical protein F0L74_20340 [Chitinophaga agrisoli]